MSLMAGRSCGTHRIERLPKNRGPNVAFARTPESISSCRDERQRWASGLRRVERAQEWHVHLTDGLALSLPHAGLDVGHCLGGLIADAQGRRVDARIERFHAGRRIEVQVGKLDFLG